VKECLERGASEQRGLRREARRQLVEALHDVVNHRRPVEDVRRAMGRTYDGAVGILAADEEPANHPQSWSRTVADVGPPHAEQHALRVQEWA